MPLPVGACIPQWHLLPPPPRRFSPACQPFHGDQGLQALLSSDEVEAVVVALPPQAQGPVIQAALRAGEARCAAWRHAGSCQLAPADRFNWHATPLALPLRTLCVSLLPPRFPAGTHVLSEKPAAPTLDQAQQLLAFHHSLPQARLHA